MTYVPRVTVIGSANMDLVIEAKRKPKLGETILGDKFHQFIGGKGANQAVAASRLGADVTFISCVGQDDYGKRILEHLKQEKVNVDNVVRVNHVETGIAQITVTENDNMIIVIPGANNTLSSNHMEEMRETIRLSDIVILQLEIPVETVSTAIQIASEYKVPIILNPAPATNIPRSFLEKVTYITPNETEIQMLITDDNDNPLEDELAMKRLLLEGANNIILTLGEQGVLYGNNGSDLIEHFASCKVKPVDSTGAGDTFNAAFGVSIASGYSVTESINYANHAAALSITKLGAQAGMPTSHEVKHFMNQIVDSKEGSK